MGNKESKWYNSNFYHTVGQGIAIGTVILASAFGVRTCEGPTDNEVELEKMRSGYILKQEDLNNNGKNEEFYEIKGQKYFSKIDGQNLENSLK